MRILDPFCSFVNLMITARMYNTCCTRSNEHDFGERNFVPLTLCLNIESALDLNLKHGQKNLKKSHTTGVALSGFDPEPSGL